VLQLQFPDFVSPEAFEEPAKMTGNTRFTVAATIFSLAAIFLPACRPTTSVFAAEETSSANSAASTWPGQKQTIETVLQTDTFERGIEQQIWDSACELRVQRREISLLLDRHRHELNGRQAITLDDIATKLAIRLQDATLSRIDNRLQALSHSHIVDTGYCSYRPVPKTTE
jgi:hypothetical protein